MKSKFALTLLLITTLNAHARVECFQKNKSVNMNLGGVIKKLNGEVVCKRGSKLQRKEFYKKGVVIKKQFFDRSEKLKTEQNFNNQKKRHGTSLEYYPSGQIKRLEVYENGKEVGPELRYYKSGELRQKTYFKENKKARFEYLEDGKLSQFYCSEEVKKFDSKKEKDWCGWGGKASEVKLYSRKGHVYKTVSYHKGKIQNLVHLNEKGIAVKSKDYAKGKRNNIEVSKFSNGKVKQEKRYNKKGYLDGLQKEYDESGTLVREANFKNGFMEFEKLYYLNKQLEVETQRKEKDKKVITHKKRYWDNGQLAYEGKYLEIRCFCDFGFGHYYSYRYCKKIGEHKQWSKKGVLITHENFKDGEFEGSQSYYRVNGKLRLVKFYKKGKFHRQQRFNDAGKKIEDQEVYPDGSIKLDLMKSPKS